MCTVYHKLEKTDNYILTILHTRKTVIASITNLWFVSLANLLSKVVYQIGVGEMK